MCFAFGKMRTVLLIFVFLKHGCDPCECNASQLFTIVQWFSINCCYVTTATYCYVCSMTLASEVLQLSINTGKKFEQYFFCFAIYCGCSGLVVEYRTRNREVAGLTHTWSTASNVEQVANPPCAQANLASYLQWDRKWVVATATGWRPSVADWGDGVSASCTVGPTVRYRGQWMAT